MYNLSHRVFIYFVILFWILSLIRVNWSRGNAHHNVLLVTVIVSNMFGMLQDQESNKKMTNGPAESSRDNFINNNGFANGTYSIFSLYNICLSFVSCSVCGDERRWLVILANHVEFLVDDTNMHNQIYLGPSFRLERSQIQNLQRELQYQKFNLVWPNPHQAGICMVLKIFVVF